jgi:hypothetical protein
VSAICRQVSESVEANGESWSLVVCADWSQWILTSEVAQWAKESNEKAARGVLRTSSEDTSHIAIPKTVNQRHSEELQRVKADSEARMAQVAARDPISTHAHTCAPIAEVFVTRSARAAGTE